MEPYTKSFPGGEPYTKSFPGGANYEEPTCQCR